MKVRCSKFKIKIQRRREHHHPKQFSGKVGSPGHRMEHSYNSCELTATIPQPPQATLAHRVIVPTKKHPQGTNIAECVFCKLNTVYQRSPGPLTRYRCTSSERVFSRNTTPWQHLASGPKFEAPPHCVITSKLFYKEVFNLIVILPAIDKGIG